MGNNSTSSQHFEKLGIPESSRKAFERKVLEQIGLNSRTGNDLAAASPEDVEQITKDFILSEQFRRFQNRSGTAESFSVRASEHDLHRCLLELVNRWLDEKRRQESQQDPSYSASSTFSSVTPKKRKRLTDQQNRADSSKGRVGKKTAVRYHTTSSALKDSVKPAAASDCTEGNGTNPCPSRSATMQSVSGPWEDIEQHSLEDSDNDNGSLPNLHQIINDRPQQKKDKRTHLAESPIPNSTSYKSKASVRRPRVPDSPDPTESLDGQLTVLNPDIPEKIALDSTQSDSHSLRDVSSQTGEATVQASTSPRQRRNIIDIERYEGQQSDDANISVNSFTSFTTPTSQQVVNVQPNITATSTPDPSCNIPTPPPTVCRPGFRDAAPFDPATPPPLPPVKNSHAQNELNRDLAGQIEDYVRRCQEHSTLMAESSSSERERQRYQHRAVAFADLEGDIKALIKAFVDKENGVDSKAAIRSVCLWS